MRTEAVRIDIDRRAVDFVEQESGKLGKVEFDQLVIATGAEPIRPDVPGVDSLHGVQTLDDGAALLDRLEKDDPKRAVIVGGGVHRDRDGRSDGSPRSGRDGHRQGGRAHVLAGPRLGPAGA